MFGDDPDPTVMTERVRFGTGFERAREGVLCIVQRGSNGRASNEWSVLRKVNRDEEEAATINGCKFFRKHAMRCS